MTPKAFLTLVAVTVVATAAAAAVAVGHYGAVQTERSAGPVFAGLGDTVNNVDEIVVVGDGTTTNVRRKGDGWVVANQSDYPANGEKVRRTLIQMTELELFEKKTAIRDRLEKLGLDDASAKRVTLKDAKGAVLADGLFGRPKLNLARVGGQGMYLRKPDSDQAWLAKGGLGIGTGPMYWIDREFIAVAKERVKRVTKTTPDGTTIVVSRDRPESEKFDIQGLPEGAAKGKDADDKAMDVARTLNAIDMQDVKPVGEVDFASGEVTTAEYVTFDGLVVDFDLLLIPSKEKDGDPAAWIKINVSAAPPAASAKAEAVAKEAADLAARYKGWVYRVSPWSFKNLQLKPVDFTDAAPEKKS